MADERLVVTNWDGTEYSVSQLLAHMDYFESREGDVNDLDGDLATPIALIKQLCLRLKQFVQPSKYEPTQYQLDKIQEVGKAIASTPTGDVRDLLTEYKILLQTQNIFTDTLDIKSELMRRSLETMRVGERLSMGLGGLV